MSDQTTKVQVSPEELNELLGPGADSILLQEETKPNFFARGDTDLSFLKPKTKEVEKKKEEPKTEVIEDKKEDQKEPATQEDIKDLLSEVIKTEKTEEPKEGSQGRPKVNKDAAIELTKKLIEKGLFVPFDDEKALEDYTTADFEELYEANIKNKEDEIRSKTPVEFFDSLPQEMQYAAKYIADGGQDLKGLFKVLSEVEEVRSLSEDVPEDQETIAREFLTVTNFGTPEEINDEVTSWKDLGKLPEKAEKFKPRLEKLRTEQIAHKLSQQENLRKSQLKAAQDYQNSVYEVLKPSEINGLKLDKKTQGSLYSGLTQAQYPSISGRNTNMLGHLLEKYQFVEPNHALIAEALWLLSDPEGYRSKVKEQAKSDTTEAIVRKLKTEETRKIASVSTSEKEESRPSSKKLQRTSNFFKR